MYLCDNLNNQKRQIVDYWCKFLNFKSLDTRLTAKLSKSKGYTSSSIKNWHHAQYSVCVDTWTLIELYTINTLYTVLYVSVH